MKFKKIDEKRLAEIVGGESFFRGYIFIFNSSPRKCFFNFLKNC